MIVAAFNTTNHKRLWGMDEISREQMKGWGKNKEVEIKNHGMFNQRGEC